MTAKGVEGAQGCLDPTCYPSASVQMGARAGMCCWAGQMTPEDLQLVCHLEGSGDDSNTHGNVNTQRGQGLKPSTEHPCLPLALPRRKGLARVHGP